jgi:hypothetical protein
MGKNEVPRIIFILISVFSITARAQDTTHGGWLFGVEIGRQIGHLTGLTNDTLNIPDSIKGDLGNGTGALFVGHQNNHFRIHGRLSGSILNEMPVRGQRWIGGEFWSLDGGISAQISPLNWFSFNAGPNITVINMHLEDTGRSVFKNSFFMLSFDLSGSIIISMMKDQPLTLPSFKRILLIGNYRGSITPIPNRYREWSISLGINVDNSYIALGYGKMSTKNMYKCALYKLIWSGPIQLLP